jgi:TolB protein
MRKLLFPLLFGVAPAFAQQAEGPELPPRESFIQIVGGSGEPIPLALPDWKPGNAREKAVADEILGVVRNDLDLSGWFRVMDPSGFVEPDTAGILPGEFDFAHWRLPGAAGLVKASWDDISDTAAVELHVYNVQAGEEMLARRLEGPRAALRDLGHYVADTIIEAFTGKPGSFRAKLACTANFGSGKEIYILDADGTNPRPVSKNGSINLSPAWSPDGGRISYTSYRDNNPDLWVTELATGRHSKIAGYPGINASAEWSRDGSEIALTLSKDGDSDIYAIDPSGSVLRRLTRQYGIDISPTFSPDGGTIAFVSARQGSPQIWLMDRDGSNLRRLTHLGGHNVGPSFSPDGTRVVFAAKDEGRFDIFVIGVDGGGLVRLTQDAADDEDPAWTPDGNFIVYASSRGGRGKQLFMMTADGRNHRQLTHGPGVYSQPTFAPFRP